jgi:predicted acetyltransferase
MITPATLPVLVTPTLEGLGGFEEALAKGWSPDPRRMGNDDYVAAELTALRKDRVAYLQGIVGCPSPTLITRAFWISDGAFAGKADLRYVPETGAVPDGVPGHVGYSVVPWKQGRGYATAALRALMDFAAARGLKELQILCNVENLASRAVIERVGGEACHRGPHPSDRPEQMKLHYRLTIG